jgi:hypothetical protein
LFGEVVTLSAFIPVFARPRERPAGGIGIRLYEVYTELARPSDRVNSTSDAKGIADLGEACTWVVEEQGANECNVGAIRGLGHLSFL